MLSTLKKINFLCYPKNTMQSNGLHQASTVHTKSTMYMYIP